MMRILSSPIVRYFQKGRLRSAIIAVLFASIFVLAACGGSSTTNTPVSGQSKKGGTLQVGLIAEPTTMDPLTSTSLYSADVMANIYDTLFRYDANNNIQPDLVSSYSYASPTELNLSLRTGIKFQDGTPFNADAVLFNLNRFLNDKTGPRYTDVSSISNVVKVSDSQVRIDLKQPFAPLLNVLTGAGAVGSMLSPTTVQKLGSKLGNAPTNVGTGPFIFVEWIKGDHLLLKANPNYWQKDADGVQLPYLQGIRFRTITNASVLYNNLETNQIQVSSNIDPNNLADARSNPAITYKKIAAPGWGTMQLNETISPLNNVHVRRAIAYAINRQEILNTVLKGVGSVSTGPLTPATWAYDKSYAGIGFDLKQAKAELAQSGMSNVKIDLLLTSGNPTTVQEAEFIQSQLQAANITVNIKQETFTALISDYQTGHYQSLLVGWTGSQDPDGSMYSLFTSTGSLNYEHYANPQVDSLLKQGRTTTNQAQRIPLYQQAEKLVEQDVACVFLIDSVVSQITTSKVKNYFISPSAVLFFSSVYLAQ